MARKSLRERIDEGLFLLDGAMGTELFARGIEAGKCNDYANVGSAGIVFAVHQAYLQAGSDAVLTNTFGANRYGLGRHGLGEMVEKINAGAVRIARRAAGEEKYVLGDIGPTGEFLAPLGLVQVSECLDAFRQQAMALVAGGVDGLIVETMMAIDELTAAIEAAKSVAGDLPVFASMSFEKGAAGFKTMMGVGVAEAVSVMVSLGVDGVGFNCGAASLEEYNELAGEYIAEVKALGGEVFIFAEPNAGKPQLVDGEAVYDLSAEDYAKGVEKIHLSGVNVIGGCCGTSPAHIQAVAKKLKK